MSGRVAVKKIANVRCYHSINLTASHCHYACQNHQKSMKLKHKLHTFAEKSCFIAPALEIILKQNTSNDLRTTFADVQPIEVESVALNQVSAILNQHLFEENKTLCSASERLKPQHISAKYAYLYPFYPSAVMVNSGSGTLPFTMTYAGKRYYSTKDGSSVQSENENKSDNAKDAAPEDSVPESKTQQLRRIFAVYGTFGFVFHIVMSLTSLGIIYLIVSSGIDVIGLLGKMGIEMSSVAGGASTMVIAYALHKLILPLRASITIVSVPILVRYLRRAGYLKK